MPRRVGSFQGKTVSPLLRKGLLRHVFGKLKALCLHADILHDGRVRAVISGEDRLHCPYALAHDLAESFPACHLVKQFKGTRLVPERKVDPAGVALVDQTHLEAFHGKRNPRADRDGVESVSIAVKIHLHHEQGVKDPQVRAASRNRLVFRSVHEDPLSFVGA